MYGKGVSELMREADTELYREELKPHNDGIQKFLLVRGVIRQSMPWFYLPLLGRLLESLAGFSHIPTLPPCRGIGSVVKVTLWPRSPFLGKNNKNKHPKVALELNEVFLFLLHYFEKNGFL